jgi:exopolysaccharide biosynthesis polyprenyl glycosylphosphotransferase
MRKRFNRADIGFLLVLDIAAFFIALKFAASFFYSASMLSFMGAHLYFAIFAITIIIANFYFFDLYYTLKDFRRYRQLVNLILAIGFSFLLIGAIAFWDKTLAVKRPFLIFFFSALFILASVNRIIFSIFRVKFFYKNTLVIGNTEIGHLLIKRIKQLRKEGRKIGINIIGYISGEEANPNVEYSGVPHRGGYGDIAKVIESNDVSLLIYALDEILIYTLDEPGTSRAIEAIIREKLKGVDLISAVSLFTAISGKIPYEYVNTAWLIEECLRGNKFTEVRLKRAADLVFGILFFLFSLPVVMICALLIKIGSKGPVFYVQERIGKFSRPFKTYKLRTMIASSEKQPVTPEGWHERNKERITRIGEFLRKYHLDELPQFLNVIKGDMSIVGPRPEMEMFTRQCEDKIPFYRLRLAINPGITGWAQVWHGHTSTLTGYKSKFQYDLYYLSNLSLKLDLEIIVRTIFRIFGYPRIDVSK